MKVEEGKIEGDITVDEEFQLNGIISGNITVVTGGSLILHGTCLGNLVIERDALANIHGTVVGDVENQGGKLEVHGTVDGNIVEVD
jgi:cytoskeletal protein CcmA (bactofilin family)